MWFTVCVYALISYYMVCLKRIEIDHLFVLL